MYHENIWDLLLKGWFSSLALPSASWVRMANVLVSLRYNPRGGGAWWAAVYGVAQSRTLLKQLCTCSSRVIIHLYYHENTIAFTVGLQRLEKKSRFSPEICGKSMATSFRNLWIRMGFLYKTPQAFNCPWRWSLIGYFWAAWDCSIDAGVQLQRPTSFLLLDGSQLVLLSKGRLCLPI